MAAPTPTLARPGLSPTIEAALRAVLGDRLQLGEAIRIQHGTSEAHFAVMPPDAVAYPENTGEVVALVRICRDHDLAVIPYGAGTSSKASSLR
jgi:D-lactate dehydrogenase (cytochrome)